MRRWDWLLDLLFPPCCPFCGRVMDGWAACCDHCQKKLPWLRGRKGRRHGEFYAVCVSPLAYGGAVQEVIHRYKFGGRQIYARALATLMAQCVTDQLEEEIDVISWAPISAPRRRRRGYDQGALLARELGRELALPVEPLLKKVRDTPPQSSLDGEGARRANAMGAYALRPGAEVAGRRILLVDDVVTSGSTLAECARLLRTAGAVQVMCCTLAQARGEGTGQEMHESVRI